MKVAMARKLITPRKLKYHPYAKRALPGVMAEVLRNRHRQWAKAWFTMPCGGDATERNTEVLTSVAVDMAREPMVCLFGRQLPTRAPSALERACVAELVIGLSVQALLQKIDISQSYAFSIREQWADAIGLLLKDLAYLGMTGDDVYDAIRSNVVAPALLDDLARARLERASDVGLGQTPPEFHRTIEKAWFEYRLGKAYQGYSPDDFELTPPRWFVVQELEIAPKAKAAA